MNIGNKINYKQFDYFYVNIWALIDSHMNIIIRSKIQTPIINQIDNITIEL